MRQLKRREFAQEASLAFLAGVAVVVSDCGGGGGGGYGGSGGTPTGGTPPTTVAPAPGTKVGSISGNHGHEAVITDAQMQSGGALTLNIAGTAGHNHVVTLPAQAVTDIRSNVKVATESTSSEGHTHTVTFNPDVPEDPTRY